MSLFIQGNAALQEVERAMQSIGYREDLDLLRRNYEYKDVLGRQHDIHTIDLAGFGQSPPTYRNVCIGVVVSNGTSGPQHVAQHRSLGAPLVFEVNGDLINRWKITASGEPELKERIPYKNIVNAFSHHKAEWEPERILRAKAVGESAGPIQLDFFDESLMPFLESRTFTQLDYLLREVLTSTVKIYKRFNRRSPRFPELFPLAFRFIAAKVFRDRKYPGGWTSDDAVVALRAIERYYNTPTEELPPSEIHDPDVLNEIWSVFLSAFYFPNLSEDDLALTFEKTFITPEIRKRLSIHSTPPRVAEYIVHKLPFDEVPEEDRYVVEPFAGHGRFLVSAMRRMRILLPTHTTSAERHDYFVKRLRGIELDTFSVEVCRLSLLLADYPNRNGWRIHNENVFTTPKLQRELRRAEIVLSNPPFEDFTIKERSQYNNPQFLTQKPAELLRRIFSAPPALLGLVLPRVFESGASYRRFHRQLAETYSNVELVALPKVFHYSDVATMLVMASGRKEHFSHVAVTCRRVNEGDERNAFLLQGAEPAAARASISPNEYLRPGFSLWIPPLSRVWDYLKNAPRLSSEAEVHRGLMWASSSGKSDKKQEDFISNKEKRGYAKGYARVKDHLIQFALQGEPEYLSLRPEDQYDNAYTHDWHLPKVICNAARLQRAPWRLGAVADPVGLAFSQRFLALWPTGTVSIYALAGLLNSPIANAYFFAKEEDRDNRLITLKSLPLPPVSYLSAGGKIDTLSREMHRLLTRRQLDEDKAMRVILELDAEILHAYNLPPSLEYELLDTFRDVERPLPFKFTSYYPKDFESYIPLRELISPEFKQARADRILERLIPINDPIISEAMALLRGELSDDEGLPS